MYSDKQCFHIFTMLILMKRFQPTLTSPLSSTEKWGWLLSHMCCDNSSLHFCFLFLVLFFSDYLFKLLLIGDSGVGKSCLLLRFAVSILHAWSLRLTTTTPFLFIPWCIICVWFAKHISCQLLALHTTAHTTLWVILWQITYGCCCTILDFVPEWNKLMNMSQNQGLQNISSYKARYSTLDITSGLQR